MTKNILFICGSLNQTRQMHYIAQQMVEHRCFFTPFFADGIEGLVAATGLLNSSVLGGRHRSQTLNYLKTHALEIDPRGERHPYDLTFIGSDLILPWNLRGRRLILVQEGITEPEGFLYHAVKRFSFLPRYLANTAASGLSDAYNLFCVASPGYRDLFIRKGVRPGKIAVTGIPNFDHLQQHWKNNFPYWDYVLVATTPHRESLRYDDRHAFLRRCRDIAAGRPVIFKLHPIENMTRAKREIRRYFPDARIFKHGSVNDMIANASAVVTQRSSCTFVALALGKELHTDLDVDELRRLMPIQNGGTSARQIASLAEHLLPSPALEAESMRLPSASHPGWEHA